MTTYYLTFVNDKQYIEIGESSFDNFWCNQGFKVLTKIINEEPDAVDTLIIKDEHGTVIELTKFLDIIGKLKIIT